MKKIFLSLMVAALAASCQEATVEYASAEGSLQIGVMSDGTVRAGENGSTEQGVMVAAPALSEFSLTITGASYANTWESISTYSPDDTRLTAGMYHVSIEAGDIEAEGYNLPYFAAETDVEVFPRNRVSEATLVATVGNSIVEIAMTDEFKSYFVEQKFTLTTASNTFELTENPSQYLFVKPNSEVAIDCEVVRQANAASGKKENLATQRLTTTARTRHIVKYSLSNAGSAVVTVTLDDNIIDTIEIENELNENA